MLLKSNECKKVKSYENIRLYGSSRGTRRAWAWRLLLAGSSIIASELAYGQTEHPSSLGLGEIVVTAQKREESLQDTPISIAVLTSEDFSNRHMQSLADLSDGSIPSLRIAPAFSRSSALRIGMRGVGMLYDLNQPARDLGAAVYLDGVYLGRAQGLGSALYDIERIEVLKGPQGTLFGRNAEAGAINIVTKAPSGRFKMDALASYGNYDSYKVSGRLELPSFHNISLKFNGLLSRRDGTVNNPAPGQQDFNAYDKRGFQAEALWQPSSDFKADYAYDTAYDATTPFYVQTLAQGLLPLAPILPAQSARAEGQCRCAATMERREDFGPPSDA